MELKAQLCLSQLLAYPVIRNVVLCGTKKSMLTAEEVISFIFYKPVLSYWILKAFSLEETG